MKRIFTNTKATLKKTKLHAIYSLIYPLIEMSVRSTHPMLRGVVVIPLLCNWAGM